MGGPWEDYQPVQNEGNPWDDYKPMTAAAPTGQDMGEGRSALQGFNSAVPFGNRITAGLGALGAAAVTGENVGDLYNEARTNQIATETANPNANLYGSIGGIVATLPVGLSKAVATSPIIGDVANALTKASTAAGNYVRGGEIAKDAGLLTRAAAPVIQGAKAATLAAPIGAVYGYGSAPEGERLQAAATNAGVSGTIAGALPIAGATAGAALGAAIPKLSEGMADIATLAQKHKIPVSLDQVSDSRFLKSAQKVSQEVPFSGHAGFRAKQMLAFQRGLFKTVGMDADLFNTKTMAKAFDKVGGEFDAITKGKTFNIGEQFINDINQTSDEVASAYGSEAAKIYKDEALKVINDFGTGDNISGELIGSQRARINKLARMAQDPDRKQALLALENNIVDGITSNDSGIQKALTSAKQRYKNLIVLEPVANKAKGGFINPTLLNNRVSQVYNRAHTVGNSGDIGELARIGHELLPELGGSDTAQKIAIIKAATYPSALITGAVVPGAAIPAATAAGLGMGINRAIQSGINRNQNLIGKAIRKSEPLKITVTPSAKKLP